MRYMLLAVVLVTGVLITSCPDDSSITCRTCEASDPAGVGATVDEEFCNSSNVELDSFEADFRAMHPGYDITCEDD